MMNTMATALLDAIEWCKGVPFFTENALRLRYGTSVAEAVMKLPNVRQYDERRFTWWSGEME